MSGSKECLQIGLVDNTKHCMQDNTKTVRRCIKRQMKCRW